MASAEHDPRTYGNWRRPGGGGLFGLSTTATYIGLGVAVAAMILMIAAGALAGFGLLVLGLLALAASSVPLAHGRTLIQTATPRIAHTRDTVGGQTHYHAGPLSRTGTFRLPGLAAKSLLTETTDPQGRPVAVVSLPKRHHHTVVIVADPDGGALVDPDEIDIWVARWGHWLATLGDEPGLIATSVTIETSPDSGERLHRELAATTLPGASPITTRMLDEIDETYPAGSATIRAYIAITFRSRGGQYRQDTARELAARATNLVSDLHGAGAGAARPLNGQELCEAVRTAYDPGAQQTFDDARLRGQACELAWDEVGPVDTNAAYGHYRHDGATSITWAMSGAPRGSVHADVLARLLSPHPDIDRKRVTLLYRPLDSGAAARIVEADHRDAEATVNNARRPTSRMLRERDSAAATAAEEAQGAGLANFGMLITATVTDPDRLTVARRAIEHLSPTARIRIRPVYGGQEAAFTACLPLGVVLPAHQRTKRLREGNL